MNGAAGSGAKDSGGPEVGAERPIRRLLVRYGRAGHVAWFGTVHDLAAGRGQAVVVLTALGQWAGEVLRVAAPADDSTPPLSGELLRLLDPADREASERSRARSGQLLKLAQTLASGSAPSAGVTVLDAEISLCGRFAMVLFAGRGGAPLGPMAVKLAARLELERVQWTAADSPLGSQQGEPSPTGTESRPANDTLSSVSRPSETERRLQAAARALTATDPAEMGSLARRERARLGLLGAYAQKLRSVSPGGSGAPVIAERGGAGEPSGAGQLPPAAPQRRWMLRIRPTAGGLTIDQLDRLGRLAVEHGDGTLRLTMRQGLQMHGVVPGSAAEVIRGIEALAMTTRGSCGNSFRNLTCCPLPPRSEVAVVARRLAIQVAQRWLPRAEWLSWMVEPDALATRARPPESPDTAYPQGYLPHKWKVGVATTEDNCIDVLTNDVALVVGRSAADTMFHVDCYVGGSLAYRPGITGSAAMLAEPLGRIAMGDVGEVLEGLAGLHREVTTSGSRHWRRLKYLVRRIGTAELAQRLEQRIGRNGLFSPLEETSPPPWTEHPEWIPRVDGRWTRHVEVFGGRLFFAAEQAGESWLRLCRLGGEIRIGPRHSMVIDGIRAADRQLADALVAELSASAGRQRAARPDDGAGKAERDGQSGRCRLLACVALPTCPLAVAEAERTAPQWQQAMEGGRGDAATLGLLDARGSLTAAISGCSNGCSHPLTSGVGIVAEGPQRFRVFVGGDGRLLGRSLGTVAGPAELPPLLRRVAERFRAERHREETFGEWWERRQS